MDRIEPPNPHEETAGHELPPYEPPRVITYRGEEILRLLGPVQACSFGHSTVVCGPSFYSTAPWEHGPSLDH